MNFCGGLLHGVDFFDVAPGLLPVAFGSGRWIEFANMVSGAWDLILLLLAAAIILARAFQGWRRGIVRQLVSIIAIVAGSLAGLWGGGVLVPLVRLFRLPEFATLAVASTLFGLFVYAVIRVLGLILFKRTAQQSVAAVRWGYGVGGALLGLAYGCFTVFLIFIAIRLTGTVAQADVQVMKARNIAVRREPPGMLMTSLAGMKTSLDASLFGSMLKQVDPMPAQVYRVLGKLARVLGDPRASARFFNFPGASELSQNPKILALRDDPEIARMAQRRDFITLLRDPKLIDAANDASLRKKLGDFELEKALDYALEKPTPKPIPEPQ
jgi:hypothetical protein